MAKRKLQAVKQRVATSGHTGKYKNGGKRGRRKEDSKGGRGGVAVVAGDSRTVRPRDEAQFIPVRYRGR